MKTRNRWIATVVLMIAVTLLITPGFAQQPNPERNAYFGETHIHTSWSFDAYVFGNMKAGPEDAYKFAMGQPIEHPAGYQVKITHPLDFMAVTDHAEYVGTVPLANDPNSPISKLPIAEKLKVRSKEDIMRVYWFLGASITKNEPIPELANPEVTGSVWKQVVSDCGQVLPAGKVHDLRGVRVDLDAGQSQHAPQHHLQGFQEGAGISLFFPGLGSSRGSMELDGRAAQGRECVARHLA